MTTEETELTFVRCPSCRSLVPAVATRCRMCGYQFEGNAGESGDAQAGLRPKSRIRQRTISVTKSEVEEMGLLDDESADSAPEEAVQEPGQSAEEQFAQGESVERDSFLQDLDKALSQPPEEVSASAVSDEIVNSVPESLVGHGNGNGDGPGIGQLIDEEEQAVEHEPVDDASFDVSDLAQGESSAESFFSAEPQYQEDESEIVGHDSPDEEAFAGSDESSAEDFAAESHTVNFTASEEEHYSQQRTEDAPVHEQEASADDAVKEEKSEQQPERRAEKTEGDSEEEPGRRRKRRRRRKKRRSDAAEGSAERDIVQEAKSTSEEAVHPQAAEEAAERISNTRSVDAESSKPVMKKESRKPAVKESVIQNGQVGVLIGWLVTYEKNKSGHAIELRSGRYFVGSERLRESDLVIEDDSISTPQCLVNSSREGGIVIQDMVSEHGTMIKKYDSDNFVEIEDTAQLEHGDCLRLGSFEVTVCLIP